ncbi:hypothetical protein WN55_08254 [Dufourea novaeangliae]|uniref:Uncharacterized protein n=1 Tax=Dufourea novaeangliae TaxID=178035 RepID=A0A154P6M9_DUFNO|nr:hypothetical protein WN55_08254 [Dufourea novaeangliae]
MVSTVLDEENEGVVEGRGGQSLDDGVPMSRKTRFYSRLNKLKHKPLVANGIVENIPRPAENRKFSDEKPRGEAAAAVPVKKETSGDIELEESRDRAGKGGGVGLRGVNEEVKKISSAFNVLIKKYTANPTSMNKKELIFRLKNLLPKTTIHTRKSTKQEYSIEFPLEAGFTAYLVRVPINQGSTASVHALANLARTRNNRRSKRQQANDRLVQQFRLLIPPWPLFLSLSSSLSVLEQTLGRKFLPGSFHPRIESASPSGVSRLHKPESFSTSANEMKLQTNSTGVCPL